MNSEKKWIPGPINDADEKPRLDELGKPLINIDEETPAEAPRVPNEPEDMETWIDGEPPVDQQ